MTWWTRFPGRTGDLSTEALFCQQLYLRQESGFTTAFTTTFLLVKTAI
jgi:hypothetical protein